MSLHPRALLYERVFLLGRHFIPDLTFAGIQLFFAFTYSIVDFVAFSASRNRGRDLSFLGTMPGLFFFLILLFLHGVDSGHRTRRALRIRVRSHGHDNSRGPSDFGIAFDWPFFINPLILGRQMNPVMLGRRAR